MWYTCQPEQRGDPRFRLGGYTATWAPAEIESSSSMSENIPPKVSGKIAITIATKRPIV